VSCCPANLDNGRPGGGSARDVALVEGVVATNGAQTVDVQLVDLTADGAWCTIWTFQCSGTTSAPGIEAFGAINWGQGEAVALRNSAAVPQLFGSEFGAPFPRGQGYTQPALYNPPGIAANVITVGNIVTLRIADASGFAWDWAYRGTIGVFRGAARLY